MRYTANVLSLARHERVHGHVKHARKSGIRPRSASRSRAHQSEMDGDWLHVINREVVLSAGPTFLCLGSNELSWLGRKWFDEGAS